MRKIVVMMAIFSAAIFSASSVQAQSTASASAWASVLSGDETTCCQRCCRQCCQQGEKLPLHNAIRIGEFNHAMEIIWGGGVDVNAVNGQGETPLHLAAKAGNRNLLCVILNRGVDVNARDMSGFTPLHAACTWNDNVQIVDDLVAVGANFNAKDCHGRTPLELALMNMHYRVALFLISKMDRNPCMCR